MARFGIRGGDRVLEPKKPEDWTEEERHELLTKSPWARDAVVKVNDNVGGLGVSPRGRTMSGGVGGGMSRGVEPLR